MSKKSFKLRASRNLLSISMVILASAAGIVIAEFTNGGFEAGDFTGWTKSTYLNPGVSVANPPENTVRSNLNLGGGGTDYSYIRTDAVTESQFDPQLGVSSTLRFPKYGNDTAVVNYYLTNSTNVNGISQTMTVSTADVDPVDNKAHIRFVVAPVLNDPNHDASEQPYYYINVRNITQNTTLYTSFKYANQPGVPWKSGPGGYLYTDWQYVDIAPGAASLAIGDQVEVEIIASRCSLGGHAGYVYVDGIGSFLPGISVVATGPESANSNSDITYTYNYRNGDSTAVENVVVTAVLPANTTFVSVNANGASCTTPSVGAAGTVECNLGDLSRDATGSFQITVHINNGATGAISHGNYSIDSDDTSALLGPLVRTTITTGVTYADLSATISDGVPAVGWGQPVEFLLTVENNGPADVTGANVSYNAPAQLNGVSWTCTGSGSATCPASGSGNISSSVNIPNGESVVFTINANVVAGTGSSSMVNLASVTAPGGVTDNVSSNNTGVDTNQIGTLHNLEVTKNVAAGGTILSVPAAISCGTSCTADDADFVSGSSVTLSAVAATNFVFSGWSGGGCSGTSNCTVTVSADTSIDATFGCNPGYYGSTCVSQCPGSGNCNGNGTCDAGLSGTGQCSCSTGFGGAACLPDADGDNIPDSSDNCPSVSNASQTDTDTDGTGDACDADDDNDGTNDGSDCAPLDNTAWRNQAYPDGDGDGVRNSTSLETISCFGSTVPANYTLATNGPDNCPSVSNSSQADNDTDGTGDACDADDDNDGVIDTNDCAPFNNAAWRNQAYPDADLDGIRDSTTLATTSCYGSTVPSGYTLATNGPDNCAGLSNPSQIDTDSDGQGNDCDLDDDGDNISDITEGSGAVDTDNDGIPDSLDRDSDGDSISDLIEGAVDTDSDGIPNYRDRDSDGDGLSDMIEAHSVAGFHLPSNQDANQDGMDDSFDSNTGGVNPQMPDMDNDSLADYVDTDSDNDGTPDAVEAFDTDNDGIPEAVPTGVDADNDGIDDGFSAITSPSDLPGYWRDPTNGRAACTVVDLSNEVRTAKRRAQILRDRTMKFSKRAEGCGASSMQALRNEARKTMSQYNRMVDRQIGSQTMSCAANVCDTSTTNTTKSKLKATVQKLYKQALQAKLKATKQCPEVFPRLENDPRKNTKDYLRDAKRGVDGLPATLTDC